MMVAIRSIEECGASEISASEPMAMPTTSFASVMLPLARNEIAATEVFLPVSWVRAVMGGGLAGRRLTSSSHPQSPIATRSQQRFVANCSESNEQARRVGKGAKRRAHLSSRGCDGGHVEPVIGRAFARPVGFAYPTDRRFDALHRHHDLAEVLVGFHVRERRANVGELVDLVDRQLQLAAFHGTPDVLAALVQDLADLLDAAGAEGDADIADAPRGMEVEVEVAMGAAEAADID